jgi:hypothetical protein
VAIRVYRPKPPVIVQPAKVATPFVAVTGLAVQLSVAWLPGRVTMDSVTALESPVTTLPAESSTRTVGAVIATVRGTQAAPDQAEVSAIVAAGAGTPGSGEISPDLPGSLVSLPGYAGSTGSVSDLFPTVNPGTGAPAQASSPGGRRNPGAEAATVSDILPLNGRLIGGQLAGLAVLVCALAAAVLRLSVRRAQS